ncbi:hypothetical protein [Rubrivivax gelatinosus]|uniref:Secreted protein n=1 Tax=Rubrivivax gelatinosus TaxID=28068 RepID=A0ABS1DX53_RUBGE|nr:hypothetical protein [Rubrivivax gelatinosus]MBK1714636.1 hypothetical protein [Rubrivivax gelatinosus]
MKKGVALAAGLVSLFFTATAYADCVCRCVNGEVRSLCSSSLDLKPICAPQVCPVVPPSIQPVPQPSLPPLGTTSCRQVQVLNPYTRMYEWKKVCS